MNLAYITLGATETKIILRIESVTCMPQLLKLMLFNQINLSVRFQDSFSRVWEHSRFIIGTVIKQTLLHKEALLDKNKIMLKLRDPRS